MKKTKVEKNLSEERAYNAFMDAINYRIQVLADYLRNIYLPNKLREEYQEKLDYLLGLRNAMF